MDGFSKILTDKWKEVIESIVVDGYSRKIESVNFFRMDKYYTGYPGVEFCYKVNFNFPMMDCDGTDRTNKKSKSDERIEKWHKELESRFTKMFCNKSKFPVVKLIGETKFENDKVDYMTNQGYRFIIQFYPLGFVSEFRNEKLEILGI